MTNELDNAQFYADFEERGYKLEAYMRPTDQDGSEWYVRALKDGKLVKDVTIPMMYVPRFGVDLQDKLTLEEKTEELLKSLP